MAVRTGEPMIYVARFLVVVIAVLTSFGSTTATSRSLEGLDATVRIEGAGTARPHLSIRLQNRSEHPIRLKGESLPWTSSPGAFIAIGELATNTPLRQLVPVSQLWPTEVILRAGEVLDRSIDLSRRFPDLQRLNKEFELVVFWAFRIEGPDGRSLRRHGSDLLPVTRK